MKFIKYLAILPLFVMGFAHAERAVTQTVYPAKKASVIALIFEPGMVYDDGTYKADIAVSWGKYQKSFSLPVYQPRHIIVRFSDMQGAGYPMKITTFGKTRFVGYRQGASERELWQEFRHARILNCGGKYIRC